MTMTTPLVRVYSDLASAEQARAQLLASGFLPDHVQLSVRDDEAGPVEGNFAVGNGGGAERNRRDISSLLDPSARFNNDIYEDDYQAPVQRGSYVLMVDATDDAAQRQASDIMDRFGATDIE
jgi:hypothetical protein